MDGIAFRQFRQECNSATQCIVVTCPRGIPEHRLIPFATKITCLTALMIVHNLYHAAVKSRSDVTLVEISMTRLRP